MPEALSDDLVATIRERVENHMTGLRITDFRVTPDRDHDGDPILWLRIVYDESGEGPRPARVLALVRELRPWLHTKLPNMFPVLRFLAAQDLADATR